MIAHCPEHGAYDSGRSTALLPCPRCVARATLDVQAARRDHDALAALRGLLAAIDRAPTPDFHELACPAYRADNPCDPCRCGADAAVRAARAAVGP